MTTQPVTSVEKLSLDFPRRIFVNRGLDLNEIGAIGFDMDYTLCRYTADLEILATDLAIHHLVKRGYPESSSRSPLIRLGASVVW